MSNQEHISTFSLESEAGQSLPNGLGLEQLDLLNLPTTQVPSSSDTGPTSKTMGMSEKSLQRRQDAVTSLQPRRPANPTPKLLEVEESNAMTVSSGRNCLALLKTSGPLGLLVKKLLISPKWDSTIFSMRWSPFPTKRQRCVFRLGLSEDCTEGSVCGSWPTPTSRDWKDTGNIDNVPENALLGRAYRHTFGQNLVPEFSEWLMGLPIGHTALPAPKLLVTQSAPK